MKTFLALIVLAVVVSYASAYCLHHEAKVASYKYLHKKDIYCEYHGTKFLQGSEWVDFGRCMKCSCSDGLNCCGIGYLAGEYMVGNCIPYLDHCDVVLLNRNQTDLCQKG